MWRQGWVRAGRSGGRGTDAGAGAQRVRGSADGRAAAWRRAHFLRAQFLVQELSRHPVMRPGTERLYTSQWWGDAELSGGPPVVRKEEGPRVGQKAVGLKTQGIKGGSRKGEERLGLGSRKLLQSKAGKREGQRAWVTETGGLKRPLCHPGCPGHPPTGGRGENETWQAQVPVCLLAAL